MPRLVRHSGRLVAIALALFAGLMGRESLGASPVRVVVSSDAPELERFAAVELTKMLPQAFADVEATVVAKPDPFAANVFVGSPATNPAVKAAMGKNWPELSDQGFVIRSLGAKPRDARGDERNNNKRGENDPGAIVVGGGSPAATLWAVYELGHRLGFRYMLREDIPPRELRPLDLSEHDVVMEPELRSRAWRTVNDFAIGPESWGLADHEPFLRQLAKLKYNRLMLSVYPWQPFVQYEFGGVKKTTAKLWYGDEFPVDGETVGKKAFLDQTRFENPDFAGLASPDEMHEAGTKHLRGLIAAAHRLGMTAGVCISPLEFPREFQPALPGSKAGRGLKPLTIVPGAEQSPTDETLRRLVAVKIRAYIETYPQLDTLYLTLPEFPEWEQHAEAAIELLKKRSALGADLSLETLLREASARPLIATGERGRQSVRGNLVALAFLHELLDDRSLLDRPGGGRVELVVTNVDPALFPWLDRLLPDGAATLNFVDYTARRVAANRELLDRMPAKDVKSQLIMTLADDNVGVLPQSSMTSLGTLTADVKRLRWEGFSTRWWIPAELDTSVYFLARSAWEKELTPREASMDLWTTTTGNEAAAERLWLAWEHLEKGTNLIDEHQLGFAFPVSGLLMKHYVAEPIPDWWQEAADEFNAYTVEMYRAHGSIEGGSKRRLFYYAKRGEFAGAYWGAVKAVREAALAKKAGDTDAALEHLEAAIDQTYTAINSLADVAQDQSDRGLIAVLNEYAFRPLLAEYDRLSESESE